MYPLRATIEEFAAEGYAQRRGQLPALSCHRLRPIVDLPNISMGLTRSISLRAGSPAPSASAERHSIFWWFGPMYGTIV
jgi:hypothetical protein